MPFPHLLQGDRSATHEVSLPFRPGAFTVAGLEYTEQGVVVEPVRAVLVHKVLVIVLQCVIGPAVKPPRRFFQQATFYGYQETVINKISRQRIQHL